jgi:hypothetical protein
MAGHGGARRRGEERGRRLGGYRRRLGAAVLWFDLPVPWGRKEREEKKKRKEKIEKLLSLEILGEKNIR